MTRDHTDNANPARGASPAAGDGRPVLDVENLGISIRENRAVDGVSLSIRAGEALALVGESGCGKSLSSLAVMGLLPDAAKIAAGSIRLNGREISGLSAEAYNALRGRTMSMIFQEPLTSLNPLMRVGGQVMEGLLVHGAKEAEARRRSLEMFEMVGIPAPETRFGQFPFELSGGMCQRVMIAMALVSEPALLIADEPTTALDVTIQAQILDLMRRLMSKVNTALLLITHDLGVVAELADRVAVMYAGRIVEKAPAEDLFASPRHPYTRLLLSSIPGPGTPPKTHLATIEGTVPDIRHWPKACRFAPRCPECGGRCAEQAPPLVELPAGSGRFAACWQAR
jgi:peptide/nickel transport system ATP-binding protein